MSKKNINKTVRKREQTIRYETWVNPETGEQREFAVVDKPYQSDYNFHKVWLDDLARIMGILGGAKIAVFNHILGHINPFDNSFGGTYTEIAERTETSKNTVSDTINQLLKADFMRKVRPSHYRINPKFLIKGGHNKRMGLMLTYNDLEEGRQLETFSQNEVENWD